MLNIREPSCLEVKLATKIFQTATFFEIEVEEGKLMRMELDFKFLERIKDGESGLMIKGFVSSSMHAIACQKDIKV
jgi:hypothetical protein